MKSLYTFYAEENGFVIERNKFEEFVKTQKFTEMTCQNRRLPINTWPEGTPSLSLVPSPPLSLQIL